MSTKGKPTKSKQGQPPPIDKLIKPAIAVGLALLAYQFFKGLNTEIRRVNIFDDIELKETFFGENKTGKSYVVLCHDVDSTVPISSVFQDAAKDAGGSLAEFRLLDCNFVLPSSGKSIAERFKLDLKKRPTIFLSGTVGQPQQIPTKVLKTGDMLVKYLRSKLEVRAAKVETTQDLRSNCLDKEICGLLLKGEKKAPAYLKDAMGKLLKEFPNVAFASVDTSVLYVLNLEEYLPELQNGQPRFVVFKKVSGSLDVGGDRLITSIAPLDTNGVSYGQMSNLVADVIQNTKEMTRLPSLPVIKTRTKKLEEEERAKRQRKTNQQKRQHEKEDTASNRGAFESNDGSRDGRRAERERRRQEHLEKNNVRPKTPEEIAEIERQRRARMEEEAMKWNVAPEDAPDEGDLVNEEDVGYVMEDLDDETETIDADHVDSDEDVIDLD